MNEHPWEMLKQAAGTPPEEAVAASRRRVQRWFAQTAPLLRWDVIDSPLGAIYIATSPEGLYKLDFGLSQEEFLGKLPPLARTERNPAILAPIAAQLRAYFADPQTSFDLALNLEELTPFQRSVLQTARRIPAGSVWTYGQVARAIGRPRASRAVGQALGRNPLPIVIPCHRVIASDGSLGGYSGGGGLASKKLLLGLENAL